MQSQHQVMFRQILIKSVSTGQHMELRHLDFAPYMSGLDGWMDLQGPLPIWEWFDTHTHTHTHICIYTRCTDSGTLCMNTRCVALAHWYTQWTHESIEAHRYTHIHRDTTPAHRDTQKNKQTHTYRVTHAYTDTHKWFFLLQPSFVYLYQWLP